MIAIFLLLVVILDTAVTGFLMARVKSLNEQIVVLSGVVKDISDELDIEVGGDGK